MGRANAAGTELDCLRGVFAVVILPTLDEEAGLARTLEDLPVERFNEPGQKIQPLIIDGGSTDHTLDVAAAWGIPVLAQRSRGKGGAMMEAIAWAHSREIPFVVVLDADATYSTDRILPAVDLLARGTDLVVGVRRPAWGPPSDLKDLVHRVGNVALSYAASLVAHRPLLDLCSGFWGVSTQRFMDLGLEDSSFAIEAELLLKSSHRGYSIHQIPVAYHERLGEAKLRALRDGGRILRTILRHTRRRDRPLPGGTAPSPWGRDVLSIALALGSAGALLECGPSEADEVRQVARFLRRTLPETRVLVESHEPIVSEKAGAPATPSHPGGAKLSTSELAVSVPSRSGHVAPTIVSIRSPRRQLTIELPPILPEAHQDFLGRGWTRSWGRKASGRLSDRKRFRSLMVVISRLDFQPEHQQETLLSANGFNLAARFPPTIVPTSNASLERLSAGG